MSDSIATSVTLLSRLRCPHDQKAWEEFHRRYSGAVLFWCRQSGLQPADAEDVTSEILQRIVERSRSGQWRYDPEKGKFRHYVRRAVSNAANEVLKSKSRHGSGGTNVYQQLCNQQDRLAALDQAVDTEALRMLFEHVESLVSPFHWSVFKLRVLDGLACEAVAEACGLKRNNINVIVFRVKHVLAGEGRAFGFGPEDTL